MLKKKLSEAKSSLMYMTVSAAIQRETESERQYCINLQKDIKELEYLLECLDNKYK